MNVELDEVVALDVTDEALELAASVQGTIGTAPSQCNVTCAFWC